MKKQKLLVGTCVKVPTYTIKKGYEISGYKPILGEKYKFEWVGSSYRVHGNWMPEMSYNGRFVQTYLVMQDQNICLFFDGAILDFIASKIGQKYVNKWKNFNT